MTVNQHCDICTFPAVKKLSAVKTIHRTWHLACDVIRCVLSGSAVRLWVTLIKLMFEDAEQAGDPVVQPHIQNELEERGQSQISTIKPNCAQQCLLMSTCRISMIFSLVSMTMMSSLSGSVWVLTTPPCGWWVGVVGSSPPPRSTTWVISSPTPWIDFITLLPAKITNGDKALASPDCTGLWNRLSLYPCSLLLSPSC